MKTESSPKSALRTAKSTPTRLIADLYRLPLVAAALAFLLALTSCSSNRPLKPGRSLMLAGPTAYGSPQFRTAMTQPENPAQSALQNYERIIESDLPLPKGSKVVEVVASQGPDHQPITKEKTVILSETVSQKTRQVEKAGTAIGAAQKDISREMTAKLTSLKGVVWVGLCLFLFGLATLFYPPLHALISSVTTSFAISAGGIALMILPSLVVGHELPILAGVALCVGGWFLAHRHGSLRGALTAR